MPCNVCYCNVAYILLLLQQEIITLNDPDLKKDVMLMVGLQDLIEQYQVIITKHLVMTLCSFDEKSYFNYSQYLRLLTHKVSVVCVTFSAENEYF